MFGSDFIANPYPTYRRLRDTAPLHWVAEFGGGAWLVPRYDDVSTALQEQRLSAKRGHRFVAQYPIERQVEFGEFNRLFTKWVVFLDPPRHTMWRKLMTKGFSAASIAKKRSRIEAIVENLIDSASSAGQMDFIRAVAYPLPAMVMMDVLGVPSWDQSKVIGWTDDIAAFFGNARCPVKVAHAARDALVALSAYFTHLLELRRVDPGDDLVSLLLEAQQDSDMVVTPEEIAAQCSALLFAGHETTRNQLGNGLAALLNNPEQLSVLRDDPSHIGTAVRELSRYDTAAQVGSRVVAEDFEWHGRILAAGQIVITMFGSANRDASKFTRPDQLDVTRKEAPHLSFGKGPHFCVGSVLANLEAEIAFTMVLERMPNLRLASRDLSWVNNINFRGLESLPIQF
jgi:cytochrome P450